MKAEQLRNQTQLGREVTELSKDECLRFWLRLATGSVRSLVIEDESLEDADELGLTRDTRFIGPTGTTSTERLSMPLGTVEHSQTLSD